jgi:hypothetical protein
MWLPLLGRESMSLECPRGRLPVSALLYALKVPLSRPKHPMSGAVLVPANQLVWSDAVALLQPVVARRRVRGARVARLGSLTLTLVSGLARKMTQQRWQRPSH